MSTAFLSLASVVGDAIVRDAAAALVSSLWQGIALASLVGFCLERVPGTPAKLRFTVWTVAFVVLAALPVLNAVFSNRTASGSPLVNAPHLQLAPAWSYALASIWLAAVLVRSIHLAMQAFKLRLLWKSAVPVSTELLPELPLGKIQLCISTELDRPSVIGFLSPRILIPAWLSEQLTSGELEQIVLHEIEHLRRRDDWMNLLQKVALVFFPLNPALFWIDRRLATERELACDDGVLDRTKAPRAYATCLTSLAERRIRYRRQNRLTTLALGTMGVFRRSEFSRRIESILAFGRRSTINASVDRAFAAVIMMVAVGGAATLARAPQVVSFTAAGPTQTAATMTRASQAVRAAQVPSARFENAVFHPQAAAENSPIPHQAKSRLRPKPRPTTPAFQTDTVYAVPVQETTRHAMLLTSWQQGNPQPVLVTLPDGRTFLATYTAGSSQAGWLLIQL